MKNKILNVQIVVLENEDAIEWFEIEKIKKETINEINKLYSDLKDKYIKHKDIVICFSINNSEFKTFEDLVKEGVFITK